MTGLWKKNLHLQKEQNPTMSELNFTDILFNFQESNYTFFKIEIIIIDQTQ